MHCGVRQLYMRALRGVRRGLQRARLEVQPNNFVVGSCIGHWGSGHGSGKLAKKGQFVTLGVFPSTLLTY